MTSRKKPVWRTLTFVGLIGGAGLLFEAQLPAGGATHTWLLLLWVGLFYATLAVWLRRNGGALEGEPPARDAVGRPIIDNGAPMFTAERNSPDPQPGVAPLPLNQSEAW